MLLRSGSTRKGDAAEMSMSAKFTRFRPSGSPILPFIEGRTSDVLMKFFNPDGFPLAIAK